MAFSDFTLRGAVDTFGLQEDLDTDLFAEAAPLELSESTRAWLDEFAPVAIAMNTEAARSQYIIVPILIEAKRRVKRPTNVFPGFTFDVDRERGLSGYCDYLISRSTEYYYLRAPLIAVVEAKREDVIGGLGQCAATLVAMNLFNERDGALVPAVYGCVSSGSLWRFLKLQGTQLNIDRTEYYLRDVGKIVGILVSILGGQENI